MTDSNRINKLLDTGKAQSIWECFTYDLKQSQSVRWHIKSCWLKPWHQSRVLFRLSQLTTGIVSLWFHKVNLSWNGVDIQPAARIGRGLTMSHPVGVVIGDGVKAGHTLTLLQHVTLGQRDGAFPVIGNEVTVYTGASVLGDICVGDGAIIGAHALVLSDVPPNTIVAGVPAKVISQF